jgi:hypothetical protein
MDLRPVGVDAGADVLVPAPPSRLLELEAVVRHHCAEAVRNFLAVGAALREIQRTCRRELHRRGYPTFEDYCRQRLSLTRPVAYRYLQAARVHDALTRAGLSPAGDRLRFPTSERQYRALAVVPAGHEAACWAAFGQSGQEPTGDGLRQFVGGWMDRQGLRPANPRTGKPTRYSELIKPSDDWHWGKLTYPRLIDEPGHHGYIPGEIYANVLWHWARPGGTVVDPMAGSGMLWHVYLDRQRWGRGRADLEFDVRLFDRAPRGPYRELISRHDLLTGFPAGLRPDTIILDPPYPLMVRGQYSDSPDDLANMRPRQWRKAIGVIAGHCAGAQDQGGTCVVLMPAVVSLRHGRAKRWLAWKSVWRAFARAGYRLVDDANASRRIQQDPTANQARVNCLAKERRVLLSDTARVLCFRRAARPAPRTVA